MRHRGALITATNAAPTADAGADRTVALNTSVQLDGSGSFDPNGDSLTYAWTQTGGSPQLSLNNASVVSPTFIAGATGVFTFSLTVTDTGGLHDNDTVMITAKSGQQYNTYLPLILRGA